ncbi:glycosyltransferase [Marinomonas sp. TI.3.20]|uniref:glycosyltransferase n=1 Tax=Marinomonas sp. TI.3.20 TaxID=3121296 RepID=UPI00311FBDCA
MKLLLVITGLGMGGAENVVVNLADALVERGHLVKIAYLTGEALVLPSNSNIEVVSIGMKGAKDFFKAYIRLRALVNSFKPDVVHSHMIHGNLLSRLVRLTVKVPKLICTAHSNNEGGKLRMLAYRLTDQLANISTNVSEEAVKAFVKAGAAKAGRMISVVNGIDTNCFISNPKLRNEKRRELDGFDQKIILAVGRLDVAKDYPNLLNTIALLKKQRQDFKVFIAGDGPLKQELLALSVSLQIECCVEFLGICHDIPALMAASDVFVLSSAWEGFGLVVAEAMSCERVVVATDCGGVADVVGDNGFLVEPRNSNVLLKAINEALDLSTDERVELGALARQRIIVKFSLVANTNAFLKLYSD